MLWMTENLSDQATWTSDNGSDPLYPLSNIQNSQTARVWKSLGAEATEVLRMDLDIDFDAVAGKDMHLVIHGHNFGAGYTLTLLGAFDPTFASIDYNSGPLDPADYPDGTLYLPLPFSVIGAIYPHWMLAITKPGASSIAQIGRVYFGPGLDTGIDGDPDYEGVSWVRVDPSPSAYTPGHQRFSERKPQYDTLDLSFSYLPESVIAQLRALYYQVGKVTPFFLQIQTTEPLNRAYYVAFTSNFPQKVKAFGGQYYWDHSLALEQQL